MKYAPHALTFISFGLIGIGAWFIYPPSAALVVGGLIYIDLLLGVLVDATRVIDKTSRR